MVPEPAPLPPALGVQKRCPSIFRSMGPRRLLEEMKFIKTPDKDGILNNEAARALESAPPTPNAAAANSHVMRIKKEIQALEELR